MSKHTPGPWEILGPNRRNFLVGRYDGEGIRTLATAHHYADHGTLHGISAEANARLIAAAPCLLQALQALVCLATTKDNFTQEHWNEALDNARVAINKAESKQ